LFSQSFIVVLNRNSSGQTGFISRYDKPYNRTIRKALQQESAMKLLCSGVFRYVSSSVSGRNVSFCHSLYRVLVAVVAIGGIYIPMAQAQTATTTTLAVLPSTSPVAAKTVVTLTATVVAGVTPVHPGLVTFCDATAAAQCKGLAVVGAAQLTAGGTAALKFVPTGGSHNFMAVFAGTTTDATSSSAAQAFAVTIPPPPYPTKTTITSSGTSGNYTLTAKVIGTSAAPPALAGNVSFLDTTNSVSLGTATLGSSTAYPSFTKGPNSPVGVGSNPRFLGGADLNNDGIEDLVTVNNANSVTPSGVTVLLGDNTGTFIAKPQIGTGVGPTGVAIADFNGDGNLDMAVANSNNASNTVTILLGHGDGTFTSAGNISTGFGAGAYWVTAGDFNNDGNLDLAISLNTSNTVVIYLGTGAGTAASFTQGVTLSGLTNQNLHGPPVVGHFTSSGNLDLAVANNSGVVIYKGNGDGTFTKGNTYAPTSSTGLAVGYFTGSGNQDLAVGTSTGLVVLLGDGAGNFSPATGSPFMSGTSNIDPRVGDFNGDGIADLATTSGNAINVLLGNGSGSFTLAPGFPYATGITGETNIVAGDLNGDGVVDLATVGSSSNNVAILLNTIVQTASAAVTPVNPACPSGTHNVDASYAGDANFSASTSTTVPLTASRVVTALSLSAAPPSPSTFGQQVALTALLNISSNTPPPPSPNGELITFFSGSTSLGTSSLSSGAATLNVTSLDVGANSLTASYAGDTCLLPSATAPPLSYTVGTAMGLTTLSVAPATVTYGNAALLTAVVAPTGATGTVSFYEGTTLLGTASLDGATMAVLAVSTLSVGTHTITAKYNGDAFYGSNTSNAATLTVTQRTAVGGGAALTVTVNDASRTTTQANPTFSYTAAGDLVNGDTYATAVTGTPTYATSAGSSSGTFAITVTGLSSTNYSITFVPGTLTVVPTSSMTTLTASPNSPQYGDPVTLTATVPSGATGTVSFYEGSVFLGQGTVTGGVATLITTTLNAGTHTVTAIYNGDATYASSTSAPVTVTVAKKTAPGGGPALTITVQSASREYGTANPQFDYIVSGTLLNGDTYGTAVTGVPVYGVSDTANSPVGSTFPISVSGLASQNYAVTFVPGTLTIVTAATTTALTASAAATQYGNPLTLTATVAPAGTTGTVVFSVGPTVLGTAAVSGGVATFTTSALSAGVYTITAAYQGDGNYAASTSSPVTVTVTAATAPGGGPALTITVANASRLFGQGNPAFSYTISGTLVNGDTYATAVTGVPVFSTTGTVTSPVGTYPISLTGGLNSLNYAIAFVNGSLTVSKGTPSVTVASSQNPSTYGTSVTFTAAVSAGATGTVTFMDGTTVLGTATVSDGTANFSTAGLLVGTYSITAVYSGDANYNAVTSSALSQVVNKNTLGVGGTPPPQIASSLNPAPFGSPVILTFTVPAGATGTVSFFDGTTLLGTGTISGGKASITTSALDVGTHTITGVYSGDSNYNGATSLVLSQVVVSLADFTVASSTGPQLIPPGAAANYNIVVSSVNAPFTSPVTMSASGLPPGATSTFSPAGVTPGAAGANTTFIVSVPQQTAALHTGRLGTAGLALLLLPFVWSRRSRGRPHRLLLWLVALASLGAVTGCGVGGYFSQPQQTYTITVTGTSGTLVHSTTVTLTVE
jgi:Bacterial Ig-like domain (group 3)/MBG domain (YGX type)/FG-GAP-like repeat